MKLVAVWVENYSILKDIGFNLGDENYFNFSFNAENRTLKVGVEPTSDYFNLFEKTKIKNISGLIGDNGSGKTSILRLINVCESKSPIVGGAVFIFRKNEKEPSYLCINYGDVFKTNKTKIDKYDSIDKILGEKNFEIKEKNNPFEQVDVLFYSNIYSDHNDNYLKMGNNLNRSVDYLTRNSLNREALTEYINRFNKIPKDTLAKEASFNALKLYFENRFKRLISFIANVNKNHPKLKKIIDIIPFPEWLTMNFNENTFERMNVLIKNSDYKFEKLKEVVPFCLKSLDSIDDINEKFRKELILRLFCFAFHDDLFKATSPDTPLIELENFVNNLPLDEKVFDAILTYMLAKKNESMFYQITQMNNIFDKLKRGEYKINIKIDRILSLYTYQLEVSDDVWSFISDISELLEIEDDPLVSFRWQSLSSGQEAMINQFLELWEGLKYVSKKSVLITIDEGEQYLHPEWQRQYVNLIFNFIEYTAALNENIDNVQILLTDHSPFIVSDIPKHNLVFLKKEKSLLKNSGEKVRVVNSQLQEATFGGNIFDLYKHSFFVDHFIGAFSTKWIEEAFKRSNGEKSYFKNDEETYSFLKLIGEKVLKDVLETSLSDKTDEEYEIINLNEVAMEKLKDGKEPKKRTEKVVKKKKGNK